MISSPGTSYPSPPDDLTGGAPRTVVVRLAAAGTIAAVVFWGLIVAFGTMPLADHAVIGVMFVCLVAGWILALQGQVRLAAYVSVGALWVGGTLGLLLRGTSTPALPTLTISLVLAALYGNVRRAVVLTSLSIAVLLLRSLLPPDTLPSVPPMPDLATRLLVLGQLVFVAGTAITLADTIALARGHIRRQSEQTARISEQLATSQEALTASEQQRRMLVQAHEQSPTPFGIADLEGRTTYVNPAFAAAFGYGTPEECVGRPMIDFFADRARVVAEATRTMRGEREAGSGFAITARRRDGSTFEAEVFGVVLTDPEGRPIAQAGSVFDISARLRTERDLAARESSLRRTGRIAKIGGWELDLVAGRPIWDDEVKRIHEVPLDYEPTLESAIGFYAPPADARITELVQRLVDDRTPFDVVLPLRTATGREIWVRSQGEAIVEDGRVVRVVGTFQDVTEQHDAALRLAAEEARSRAILDASSDRIFLLDADGTITFEAPACERVLGFGPADLVGTTMFRWVHADDLDRAQTTFGRLLEHPFQTVTCTLRQRHRDGTWRRLEITARNLLHVRGVNGILAMGRDVTDRQALEERLRETQKLEGLGRLAGGIAHDFNNLLTAILGYSEDLVHELPPGRLREDVEQIAAAGHRARELTAQLLAFARRQIVQPKTFDPGARVGESLRMLTRVLGEDIALRLDVAPGLPSVRMDPAQFDQIVLNLAVNARDAMPDGGRLDVRLRHRPESGPDHVEMLVRDSGVGMSPDVLAQVFEPFFTTKELGHGTGMGLATVYGIVQQAGGTIAVESVPGHGTTFTVVLPGVAAPPDLIPVPTRTPGRGRGERLLLVEDDDAVREFGERTLREAGYAVTASRSGIEALLAMRTAPAPHLLVTDVVMPGMSGRDLAERLRERWPSLPVAYVSGYPQDRLRTADGELPFLPKPYSRQQLLELVEACLTPSPAPGHDSA
ncbi:MAG: PAS domain S-box protein [Gemmatimonadaceae bacterium]|nr:PAS domain S-box protein [Gemmatimonadaceae bacterium]